MYRKEGKEISLYGWRYWMFYEDSKSIKWRLERIWKDYFFINRRLRFDLLYFILYKCGIGIVGE